jgi:hypothetical protein
MSNDVALSYFILFSFPISISFYFVPQGSGMTGSEIRGLTLTAAVTLSKGKRVLTSAQLADECKGK